VGVSRDCPIFGGTPIISGTGKATNFKFGWNVHRIHPNKSPLKIFEKREPSRIQELPIFEYPQLSQQRVKLYELQIWTEHSQAPSEQKPIKIFE